MINAAMTSTDELEKEAIDWLKSNLINVHSLVCISGGKDSIVIEKLSELAGLNYSINSTATGIDPPELVRFIKKNYPACTFSKPRQSFWHLITTCNPPAGTGRGIKWCCTKIKEIPSDKIPITSRIVGIRAEESGHRAKYERINHVRSNTHYYPVFSWKEWNVWEFIEKYKLPYPSLYDEGFSRLGCVVCPNHHNRHEPYRKRWPNHFLCFERYVRIWFEKRKGQGRDMYHNSVEDFLADWYTGKFYYYKHKKKEGNK